MYFALILIKESLTEILTDTDDQSASIKVVYELVSYHFLSSHSFWVTPCDSQGFAAGESQAAKCLSELTRRLSTYIRKHDSDIFQMQTLLAILPAFVSP